MAEGEDAVITEIPKHIFPLVPIRHTKYDLEFDKLGLRWVPAPALSRLGFDIGGVQYTATPFVGWFMDAEIGVRDLADRQRYNVLPSIIEVLGWVTSVEAFEELLEMDKLRLLVSLPLSITVMKVLMLASIPVQRAIRIELCCLSFFPAGRYTNFGYTICFCYVLQFRRRALQEVWISLAG